MNISIDKNRAVQFQAVIPNNKDVQKEKKLSGEQLMINQFKEQNSKQNNRISQIYGKFRAGKKLSLEELDYIAKESPELYRQIRQVMMERQAMEEQMEMAKSKEEVAQIHANELSKIQISMGKGEQAGQNAEINMARANQIAAAYNEFTASLEYTEKEDMESRTEEKRDLLKELEREQETYRDKIADKVEDIKIFAEEISEEESEEVSTKLNEADMDELSEETLEFEDKDHEVKHRKRSRKSNKAARTPFIPTSVDLNDLRLKVRELYRGENKGVTKNESNKGKGVDLSL